MKCCFVPKIRQYFRLSPADVEQIANFYVSGLGNLRKEAIILNQDFSVSPTTENKAYFGGLSAHASSRLTF